MSDAKGSFEDSMKKLEKIVDELDKGEYSLEESLHKFEEGLRLGKSCKEILEKAELRVRKLVESDDGGLTEEDAPDES
jgi:exodeoxyribonuclease VII small subunit